MTKDKALQMAINALTNCSNFEKTINACKEALADNSFCKHGLPRGICTLGEKDCE